ncbi:unnamed protein product [Rangifer tarandus platyrhynchus]|uniref:Uncharacterized protein n=1 Tax=Rangifer tarandus platyrhynchus TaxID=3082113 RepID=A0ABN8Z0B6_RANTA|nr:unnamed protein product [Rangifer tarandus platyrhynchus]
MHTQRRPRTLSSPFLQVPSVHIASRKLPGDISMRLLPTHCLQGYRKESLGVTGAIIYPKALLDSECQRAANLHDWLVAQAPDRHGSPRASSQSQRCTQTHLCPFPMQQPVEPDLHHGEWVSCTGLQHHEEAG